MNQDNEKKQTELEKLKAEVAHVLAQTIESNKRSKWYEVTIAIAATLAIVAITKLFL